MVGPGALQEENGSFVPRAGWFLQRGQLHEDPRAFAVIDDPGDVKVVLQHAKRFAHFYVLGSRLPIINEHVIPAFHIVPLEKYESTGDRGKAFRFDAVDDVDASGGIEL